MYLVAYIANNMNPDQTAALIIGIIMEICVDGLQVGPGRGIQVGEGPQLKTNFSLFQRAEKCFS